VTYIYDGDGNRVEKYMLNTQGQTVFQELYWYGGGSAPLDETDGTGSTTDSAFNEYVFFNGARTARRNSGGVYYYFADHLGTSREIVQSGSTTPCYDADFTPYGVEIPNTNTCAQNYKFTGKERDTESGLDNFEARYNASSLGRFMSPDPGNGLVIRAISPQRWNMYAYAINNPTSYNDPTGTDAAAVNFSSMVGFAGHEALLVIDKDGSTTFASFGPASHGPSSDFGASGAGELTVANSTQPTSMSALPTVEFGANGLPTPESFKVLVDALAKIEGVDPASIKLNYFQTSEADTQMLRDWVALQREEIAKAEGQFCMYSVFDNNCDDFTAVGLLFGNAITRAQANSLSAIPNVLEGQLAGFASYNFQLLELSQPQFCVTVQGNDGPKSTCTY
jgi:RHS repeat-associated protein